MLTFPHPPLALQDYGSAPGMPAVGIGVWLLWCAILIFELVAMWRVFEKAGEPGWAAIIPIFNLYILLRIAGRSGWWLLLFLIPLVNVVIGFIVMHDVAERFGHGWGFALGLVFLGFIFFPILAFGDSTASPKPATA
jgi:hypothetical protein